MKVLIIAPHQDDEILAAGGLIQRLRKNGARIAVLFATNGDYHGPQIALQRYCESCNALKYLGVSSDEVFYLGYGDTGMHDTHSFLRKLRFASKESVFSTPFSTTTYHPAKKLTVHALRTGEESLLTHGAFIDDLTWFINQYMPDLVIFPHPNDQHGDHAAISVFLQATKVLAHIPFCLTYIIHGGNDMAWPHRDTNMFLCPPVITEELWKNRISILLTDTERHCKIQALQLFETQHSSDTSGFLFSFCKQEEVFFLFAEDNLSQQNI